jgi:myo-inositol 2-dehydrogenase / D-chiro-inositol 1-dehydrogenase
LRRGTGAASQALSTQGNVKLVGVADAFEDSAKNSLKNLKTSLGDKADRVAVKDENIFTGFDAYQKLIDSGIDLVILATPPGFRPIHFEYAVKAGKNIFMEKPVAVDAPGVRQVLEANKIAKEKKLKVGVGLQRHHQAGYIETINRLKDGAIGDILALRVYWNGGGVWDPRITRAQAKSEMEYQMRNWYYYNWLCGDHICEQHIHNLDVGNWVKGAYPVKANGMGGRQVRVDKKYGEIYDHHYVEYEFADGTHMYSQCRHIPNCWNSVTEYATGSKGTVDISGYKIKPKSGEEWSFGRGRRAGGDPYQVEHDDLFAAIRSGAEYNEADNGAMSTMTAVLGRMCTYSGKVITMDDALASNISLMPKTFAWDADPPVMPREDGSYPIATPGVTKVV